MNNKNSLRQHPSSSYRLNTLMVHKFENVVILVGSQKWTDVGIR